MRAQFRSRRMPGPVFALWYGGSNYAAPDPAQDVEVFQSLALAIAAFNHRSNPANYSTPGVERIPPESGGPEMQLFSVDPREHPDAYPERLLVYGPRGGLVNVPA